MATKRPDATRAAPLMASHDLSTSAAGNSATAVYRIIPLASASITQALLVALLAALLECSPLLARLAGRLMLRWWPGLREA